MLRCPFCQAIESDRFVLEDHRFIVFPCLFTAEVSASAEEAAIQSELRSKYLENGDAFFRRTCDQLHRFVTRPDVARVLGGRTGTSRPVTPS